MSFQRNSRPQGGTIMEDNYWAQFVTHRNSFNGRNRLRNHGYLRAFSNSFDPFKDSLDYPPRFRDNFYDNYSDGIIISSNHDYPGFNHLGVGDYGDKCEPAAPSWKRRKFSDSAWGDTGRAYFPANGYVFGAVGVARMNPDDATSNSSCKRGRSKLGDDEPVFLSRDEIERHSPSRKDGIDALRETHLRYSYCGFLQSLGLRLELPQTTIGTAMVLCHRFFVRRSHACHDRFLIATAALFLAAKSEETSRPLNNVLRASSELYHKQDMSLLSYLLPVDWFEQYRERVLEAENMILATLNFELNVQHPYAPLTSTFNKLGLSQSVLVLALNLVSEGLRSSLWLQFKPHHIAAGAAYLAGKFLHMDLSSSQNIWQEFQTTPAILQDVSQQLMELF